MISNISSHQPPMAYSTPSTTAGGLVSGKIETLVGSALALRELSRNLHKGPRLITSITTFATGVSQAAAGNLLMGVPLAATGAAEVVSTLMHGPSVDVRNILDDSRAGLDMMKVLSRANLESYSKLDRNLSQIEQNLDNLNAKIIEINSIAVESNIGVENQKNKALSLFNKSKELFESAKREFISTENEMKKAGFKFNEVSVLMNKMIELIQSTEGDLDAKLVRLSDLALAIQNISKQGMEAHHLSSKKLADAMELFNLANSKQAEALEEFGKAVQMGQDALKFIATKAEHDRSTEKLVLQARNEVKIMQERTHESDHLIERLQTKLDLLEKHANNGPSWLGIVSGSFIGYTAAYALSAAPIPGASLVVGSIALANQTKESLGLKPAPSFAAKYAPSTKVPMKSLVSYDFEKKSTGFWGRFVEQRQSWTVGKVAIKAGDEEIKISFDANAEGDSKISDRHQYELLLKLSSKVSNGTLSAEDCLAIINQLERAEISRKGSGKKDLVGFIPPRSPYFRELERQCLKIIDSVNHSA